MSDIRSWQVVEVDVRPSPSDGLTVNHLKMHTRLANLLNERGIGPGEVIVPQPDKRDVPSSTGGYRFYMMIFAPKRDAWVWQITT